MQDQNFKKGKSYCLRLLTSRPRTEYELKVQLENKGYSSLVQTEIINALKEKKLINDLVFAEQWIDSRIRSNPRSKRLLERELLQKGVPDVLIEKTMRDRELDLDDAKTALALAKNRLNNISHEIDEKEKGRLLRFLLSKGFEEEIAMEIIEKLANSKREG